MNSISPARLALFVLLIGGCGSPSAVDVSDLDVSDLATGREQLVRLHFDNFMKSKSGAT